MNVLKCQIPVAQEVVLMVKQRGIPVYVMGDIPHQEASSRPVKQKMSVSGCPTRAVLASA
jgi:hypothetical protein